MLPECSMTNCGTKKFMFSFHSWETPWLGRTVHPYFPRLISFLHHEFTVRSGFTPHLVVWHLWKCFALCVCIYLACSKVLHVGENIFINAPACPFTLFASSPNGITTWNTCCTVYYTTYPLNAYSSLMDCKEHVSLLHVCACQWDYMYIIFCCGIGRFVFRGYFVQLPSLWSQFSVCC